MLSDGLPGQLEPALRFLFSGQAPLDALEASRRIEGLRAKIAERDDTYSFGYFETSLGAVHLAQHAARSSGSVTLRQCATAISVPRRWGLFLHLCARAFNARTIVEMGACVGISGAYLASIRLQPRFFTLEGSEALAQIAQATLAAVSDEAEVVVGMFEHTLSPTLERAAKNHQTVDLAYVDGHHGEAATLDYVETISRHLSSPGLIILDDLYLSQDMWRAWRKLSSAAGVVSINLGRFGLLVYGSGMGCRRYDLSRYTGFWRVANT
jgi:predicted O-methyltransferase YrrM